MNVAQRRLQRRQVVMNLNPLRADPTLTATLRRLFVSRFRGRFQALRRKVLALVVEEDAFGLRGPSMPRVVREGPAVRRVVGAPVANQRWRFRTEAQKLEAFQVWLAEQIQQEIFQTTLERIEDAYWTEYIRQAYFKGAGRAFDDTKPPKRPLPEGSVSDFYKGTRSEFLRSSFANPQSVEKVKLLAARVYSDLNGVTQTMATQMSRILVDGFARGENPRKIGDSLSKAISSIGEVRAATIARTEVIRAHAEGQLDALERLGVTKVGVMVEWSVAPDGRLCELCAAMGGTVMTIQEARGMIPRHPNCRCAFIPANVGEETKGQVRSKTALEKARDESIRREIPKRSNRSLKDQKKLSKWAGADTTFQKDRPEHKFAPVEKPPEGKKVKPKPKPKPKATPPKAAKPKAEPKPKKVKYKTFEEGMLATLESKHLDDIHKKFLKGAEDYRDEYLRLSNAYYDAKLEFEDLAKQMARLDDQFNAGDLTHAEYIDQIEKLVDKQWELTAKIEKARAEKDAFNSRQKDKLLDAIRPPEKDRVSISLSRAGALETVDSSGKPMKTIGSLKEDPVEAEFQRKAKEAQEFVSSLTSRKGYPYGVKTNLHRLPSGQRAFARSLTLTEKGGIYLDANDRVATFVHELGHIVENHNPRGDKIAERFRQYRIAKAGTKDVKMIDQFPDYRYDPWEVGNKDGFDKVWGDRTRAYYAGKSYGGSSTEIISMGLEELYEDPVGFAEKDPEYFKFIVGFLRGDFNDFAHLPIGAIP